MNFEPPSTKFDSNVLTWKEIQKIVQSAKSCSVPGPNGVTYLVYKRCPNLLKHYYKIKKNKN